MPRSQHSRTLELAIFHLRQTFVGAGSGRSSVGMAAYRHSARLEVEATGEVFDYTRKAGTVHCELSLPDDAPVWVRDALAIEANERGLSVIGDDAAVAAGRFWNSVENFETRSDAQFARETTIALPIELSREENIELVRAFVAEHMTGKGYVADWAYHDPDKAQANPHVHLLSSLRPLTEDGFGRKTHVRLDADGEVVRTRKGAICYEAWAGGKPELMAWREGWAEHANIALARAGHDRTIDHRSFEAQGIFDKEPTQHHGRSTYRDIRGESATIVAQDVADRVKTFAGFAADPSIVLRDLTRQQSTFDDRDIARLLHRYAGPGDDFEGVRLRVGSLPELMIVQAEIHDPESNRIIQRARYTTVEVLEREARMIESARSRGLDRSFGPDRQTADAALERSETSQGFAYSGEQRGAIDRLSGQEGLAVMVGFAGAGKSTVLRAVGDIYAAENRRVVGAALAGKAAEGLQQSSGIESRTIASWERAWSKGYEHLSKGDVFVLDEAGMVASAQMDRVLKQLDDWQVKVVLVGDSRQLQPIEAGAAFRAIANEVGYVELNEVRRQITPWQAEAAIDFGRGDAVKALDTYDRRGSVHLYRKGEDARASMVREWRDDWRVGADVVMLVHTNKDVAALNVMARAAIKRDGGLAGDAAFTTARGPRDFAVGDRVIFLENSRDLDVKNGTLGTVLEAEKGKLVIDVAHLPEPVRIDQAVYANVDHGYALTIHKTQGATVDRTHVLATGMMDAQLSYVAMTRHREDVTVHISADTFGRRGDIEPPSRAAILERLSSDGLKDTTLEYERTDDYGASRVEAAQWRAAETQSRLERFLDLRGLPSPTDVLAAIEVQVQRLHGLVGRSRSQTGRFGTEDIRVSLADDRGARAPTVPALPEHYTPIIARLEQVQSHSDAMGGEGNARRHAFHYAENALHRAPTAQRLLEWSQDVSDIVAPATVLAIGRDFDEVTADRLLAALAPATRASLEENWTAVHAVSRAAHDVGLLDSAHRVHSSLRAEVEAERVETEYRRGLGLEVEPREAPDDRPQGDRSQSDRSESDKLPGAGKTPPPVETTIARPSTEDRPAPVTVSQSPAISSASSANRPLLPAIRDWPETIDEMLARTLPQRSEMRDLDNELLHDTGVIWRSPETVWATIRSQALSGDVSALTAKLEHQPESFGPLQGEKRLLRGPDARREQAMTQLAVYGSTIRMYAEIYPQYANAARREEVDWRQAHARALPALSDEAATLARELARGDRLYDAGHRPEADKIHAAAMKNPRGHGELKAWQADVQSRFGDHRSASELPGIDPDDARLVDSLREAARVAVPLADHYVAIEARDRQIAIDRSRGIEREGPEWGW